MQLSGENVPQPSGYTSAIHHCVCACVCAEYRSKIDHCISIKLALFCSCLLWNTSLTKDSENISTK